MSDCSATSGHPTHLSHVKVPNTRDLEVLVDNGRQLSREKNDDRQLSSQPYSSLAILTFLCVLLKAISMKSEALGTGAMALNPPNAVAILMILLVVRVVNPASVGRGRVKESGEGLTRCQETDEEQSRGYAEWPFCLNAVEPARRPGKINIFWIRFPS